MKDIHVIDVLENIDFTTQNLPSDRIENMHFKNCQFNDVAHIDFTDCLFENCNLSNVNFNNCKMDNVGFKESKTLGIDLSKTKDFGFEIHFSDCALDYSIFDYKKMNKSSFENCQFTEANFTNTDLSKCKFNNCTFQGAVFVKTNLTSVDFRTCSQFQIDPQDNFIKKAKFRTQDLAGLLYRYDIVIS